MNITRVRADRLLCAGLVLSASLGSAQDLSLPAGATETAEVVRDPSAYALPTDVWQPELGIPSQRIEGRIATRSWRIDASGLTPLQLIAPLRAQLQAAGFEVLVDCAARTCGGFDFRFALPVLPAPAMFVDLLNFHFVSLRNEDGDGVTLLASRDESTGYVQIVRAGTAGGITKADGAAPVTAAPPALPPESREIAQQLDQAGYAILRDMLFETGSASLGENAVASLDAIAAYLAANPSRQILFVGHTDATGSLEANQALSRRRAQAAVDYLRKRHGTPAAQIGADGVGYLSPIASNLTAEGRDLNRRVEAVLISTE
jgi:outer membrane protein OmpA-like peptidoglycan-associated protein